MKMIDVFNSAVSNAVNKNGDFYRAWIGQSPFIPELTILESSDYNCGAVCNELEFARLASNYLVQCLAIDIASDEELDLLINAYIDLPRRGTFESNSTFRNRFKFIVVENVNERRTTRWAILDALRYFLADVDNIVQIIEPFSSQNLYFQVRFEGVISTDDIIFLNNIDQSYIDQDFIGGPSVGDVITYITFLIQRIKAAGVDFDVIFINQYRVTKTSSSFIGTIQRYKSSSSRIKAAVSFGKNSNATIV